MGRYDRIIEHYDQAATADAIPPTDPQRRRKLNVVCVADVQAVEVDWIWKGRIPIGKQTLLTGDPGVGKSYFACDLGARITRGMEWPDGSGAAPPGEIAYIMCEDGIGDTYRPRLDALGADVNKAFVLQTVGTAERLVSLDADCDLIDEFCHDHPDLKAIVVDPLQGFLGQTDSNNNAEVRRVLGPLNQIAERHRVALITIDHMTKQKNNSKALYRSLGTIGLIGNARAAHVFVHDRDDKERVLMLPTKSNLHKKLPGLAYRIVDGRVEWEDDPVDIDADDALSDGKPGPNPDKFDQARDWLLKRLSDGRWHDSNTVKDEAMAAGVTFRTYRRAKDSLQVESQKGGQSGKWSIRIGHGQLGQLGPLHGESPQDVQDVQDVHPRNDGHLPADGWASAEAYWKDRDRGPDF